MRQRLRRARCGTPPGCAPAPRLKRRGARLPGGADTRTPLPRAPQHRAPYHRVPQHHGVRPRGESGGTHRTAIGSTGEESVTRPAWSAPMSDSSGWTGPQFLVVTSNDVPGYRIDQVLGEVFGLTVRSRNAFSQMGAGTDGQAEHL